MTPNCFNEIFSFTSHFLNKITFLFCFLFLAPYVYQRLLPIRELQKECLFFTTAS